MLYMYTKPQLLEKEREREIYNADVIIIILYF